MSYLRLKNGLEEERRGKKENKREEGRENEREENRIVG